LSRNAAQHPSDIILDDPRLLHWIAERWGDSAPPAQEESPRGRSPEREPDIPMKDPPHHRDKEDRPFAPYARGIAKQSWLARLCGGFFSGRATLG